MKANDDQIIESIKTGCSSEILEELYIRIFPKVKAYITGNSGSNDDAFDIFQDAIVILCRYIRGGKYDTQNDLAAFLYSVSRNLWINKVKRDRKQSILLEQQDISDTYDFSNDIITPEKERYINGLIKKLGEKCFRLLQYSVYQRRSNTEICQLMQFATENSVKTQKYKCKQKLLQIMDAHPSLQEIFD